MLNRIGRAKGSRVFALALVFALRAAALGLAQEVSDPLSRADKAYELGNFPEAAKLLSYALNPAFNLPDGLWVRTVQRLAHSLIQVDRPDLAGVWLRWALRHRGRVTVDDVNFPPAVVRAFAEASRAVEETPDSDTPIFAVTRWRWPEQPQELVALGGIVVSGIALDPEHSQCRNPQLVLALGRLVDLGNLTVGTARYIPPETYMISDTAPGCGRRWVYREILPGVVTELTAPALLTVYHNYMLLVYIDGELVGITAQRRTARNSEVRFVFDGRELKPVRELPVLPGTRRIELRDGVNPRPVADTTIEFNPGDVRIVEFSGDNRTVRDQVTVLPSRDRGLLYVISEPEAAVYLDDELIGAAASSPPDSGARAMVGRRSVPFVLGYEVPAGAHSVSVRRAGYLPFDTVIVFGQQLGVRLKVVLRRRGGEARDSGRSSNGALADRKSAMVP
ncbi:MAG: hypothetical protein KatS3mg081_2594 [Gemmatimonadales bacterium]|nr:MAG: hypothetical protein KatS3mg081_2594 [Gemmatimonadales bacterium]